MASGFFTLNQFSSLAETLSGERIRMPVLFVGHGSPMNAIEENEFSRAWQNIGASIGRPKAILCISAHWNTAGSTLVTAMAPPETIHDFYGFPSGLFAVQYPAPVAAEAAQQTIGLIKKTTVLPAPDRGLDHGCWSVLKPMFPKADVPVFQLSIDLSKPPRWHYELAQELKALRAQGVLIMGSGNIVHNLKLMQWNNGAFDWALEFDQWSKERLLAGDHGALVNYAAQGKIAQLAIPTNEHYLPLIYAIALQDQRDELRFFNEKTIMGSVSMRSVLLGGY